MALSAATVWEVRASGASDSNGGGFVAGASGTDWSQQNSPQYALAGIASVGAGNVVLSAAAAADMVGNIAQVISGTNYNTGFFQITAVSVGVSITFSTNNAGQSISSGVGASGVINIGGALATVAAMLAAAQPANTAYLKGTFTITTILTFAAGLASTAGNPFLIIGYTTTRGDNGRATITTATNGTSLIVFKAGGCALINIALTNTAGTRASGIDQTTAGNRFGNIMLFNCILDGFTIGINADDSGSSWAIQGLVLGNCEIKNCSSHGIFQDGPTHLFATFIHDCAGSGIRIISSSQTPHFTIDRCIFYNNGTSGLVVNQMPFINQGSILISNSCFSTNTGAGILIAGVQTSIGALTIVNCIFDRNTTYGIDNTTSNVITSGISLWNNAFYLNTTAATHQISPAPTFNTITLSADPYTSVGTDFSLNSTAGGGAAVNGAGFPGVLIAGGTGFASPGALAPSTGGGGGTTIVIGRNVTTYLGEQGDF